MADQFDEVDVAGGVFASRRPRKTANPAEEFLAKAVYAARQVQRAGMAVTTETICGMNPSLPRTKVAQLWEEPKFQDALAARGITIDGARGLSARQLHALSVYQDMSVPLNHAQRLRAAGVSQAEWDGWMRQPDFSRELVTASEERLVAMQPRALLALGEAVDRGDRWAVELQLEMTRRHDRRVQTLDPTALMMQLFGILDEELARLGPRGDEILERISGKVRSLTSGAPAPALRITPSPAAGEDSGGPDHHLHAD